MTPSKRNQVDTITDSAIPLDNIFFPNTHTTMHFDTSTPPHTSLSSKNERRYLPLRQLSHTGPRVTPTLFPLYIPTGTCGLDSRGGSGPEASWPCQVETCSSRTGSSTVHSPSGALRGSCSITYCSHHHHSPIFPHSSSRTTMGSTAQVMTCIIIIISSSQRQLALRSPFLMQPSTPYNTFLQPVLLTRMRTIFHHLLSHSHMFSCIRRPAYTIF